MIALFALMCAFPAQEAADDLRKEIEKLRTQNRELQDRVTQLDEAAVRDAEMIQRLRSAIKTLEAHAQPASVKPADGLKNEKVGPRMVLKGRVIHVESKQPDPKYNFLLVDLGRDRRLEPGYKFEVVRTIHEKDKPDRLEKIGVAEFDKYIGPAEESSKLKIIEGSATDMKIEDEVVAIRPLSEVLPRPEAEPAAPAPAKNGLYKIILIGGRGKELTYTSTFGKNDGAKQSDIVFVYRDGVLKGKLRLDTVTADYSVSSLISPVKEDADRPQVGDQVFRRELQKSLTGKVALIDDKRGVATDLRERDGVKPGQKIEVRRLGQKIGTLVVTDVQAWGSWAKPEGETKLDSIQKGDFVEALEDNK